MNTPERRPVKCWADTFKMIRSKYGSLAGSWAARYAKQIGNMMWYADIKEGIIANMVQIYEKYYFKGRPESELSKLVKTTPRNYWALHLKKKEWQIKDNVADLPLTAVEKKPMVYDVLFQKYEDKQEQLKGTDPLLHVLLFEVATLQKRGRLSKKSLQEHMAEELGWSQQVFATQISGLRRRFSTVELPW